MESERLQEAGAAARRRTEARNAVPAETQREILPTLQDSEGRFFAHRDRFYAEFRHLASRLT